MGALFFLFFIVLVGIFVAVVVLDRQARQKRIEEMRAVAARLGYEYAEDAGMLGTLEWFDLLSRGHSHTTANLLRAETGGALTAVFDWSFSVGHGKHRHNYRQSVLLLESPQMDLPAFALRPEGLGSKILGMLGQQDLDFEDSAGFSDAYVLQGADEAGIRALFDDTRLAFFARRPGLRVHGRGSRLLYYREDRRLSPAGIPAFVDEGLALLELLTREAPPPAEEPDPLAGLEELLTEMGVDVDETEAGSKGA